MHPLLPVCLLAWPAGWLDSWRGAVLMPSSCPRRHSLLLSCSAPAPPLRPLLPTCLHACLPTLPARSCKPLMIATYTPEEGPLREHLLDRIAMTLSADVASTFEQRVFAVESATRFQDKPQEMLDEAEETTDNLRTQVGGLHLLRELWAAAAQGRGSVLRVSWQAAVSRLCTVLWPPRPSVH